MKRSILIPIDDETSEKTADEILAEAFNVGGGWHASVKGERMVRFVFYWEKSETVLEVVNKLNFVETVEEAEVAADYIRKLVAVPLKELPRERSY